MRPLFFFGPRYGKALAAGALILLSGEVSAKSGDIVLNSYSWSATASGVVIKDASASPDAISSLSDTFCIHNGKKDTCGIAVSLSTDRGTNFYLLSSGPANSYTVGNAIASINTLPGKTIAYGSLGGGGATVARGSCLYQYSKASGFEGYELIHFGVCSGGDIPPVPEVIQCDLSLPSGDLIDFGDISATKFVQAGAGNKPEGVREQSKTLEIKCNRPNSSPAYIHLNTLGAASGNIVISNNRDVGFILTGSSETSKVTLTPNSASSAIVVPFRNETTASAIISANPVSVTGNKPVAGEFLSTVILSITWN